MQDNRKLNRQFILRVEVDGGQNIEINSPLTLDFTITRNNLASSNTAHFVIYNLAPQTRHRIYKDMYDIGTLRAVQLFAGYGSGNNSLLPRVFNGTIKRAFSHRQGSEVRTEIEAFDGTIAMSSNTTSLSLPAGSTKENQIYAVISTMLPNGIDNSTIGNKYKEMAKRGVALFGTPMDILSQLTDAKFYVDSGHAYALDTNEVITGDIQVINYQNGLLGTPRKSETMVEIDMIFEPRLKPSQLLRLESETDPRFNGTYKVTGITHRGTISGSVANQATTALQMIQVEGYSIIFDKNTTEYRLTNG